MRYRHLFLTGKWRDLTSMSEPLSVPGERVTVPIAHSYRATAMIVACALFMEQLDGTVLATALPSMARSMDVDPLHMNVALTSYMLSLAVFIPASGRIADRFGSRSVFRAAIGLFTLGSILCAQTSNLWFLVAARIIQGTGGAMMVPVGRLVLLRTTPKSELVNAMAWLLVPATLGPMVGPPLGGFLVTYLSWRWIFFINVPIGILGFVLAGMFIEQVREDDPGPLDFLGIAISGTALCALTFGLESVARGMGSVSGSLALVGIGVAAAFLYARHSRHQRSPILDFRLMRVNTFATSVLSGSLFRIAFGAVPFLLPLTLQLGFGMTAAASGAITFASSVGSLLMRGCAKRILRRLGFRRVITVNGVISMSLLACDAALRPSWPEPLIYFLLFWTGFFMSLQFTSYNTIAYADLPAARMSAATSFYSTFQQLSLSMGITVSAGVLALSVAAQGHPHPEMSDFSIAFLVIAAIGMAAAPAGLRMPANAGEELSGHHPNTGGH